jgi:hypothetical protein
VEAVFGFLGIILFWVAVNWIFRAGAGTVRAAARAASGKGSFADNFQASVLGMKPIEVRLHDNSTDGIEVKEIQVKGILPIRNAYRLGFVTSVFDNTSGEFEPVVSSVDQFQEPHTIAYQHAVEIGPTEPGIGFITWVRAGVVLPQILEPPYGGKREFAAVLRLINLENKPDITNGYHDKDHSGLLWQTVLKFEYKTKSKGYLELAESRDAARAICVKIAMAIAMWDGALADKEGQILKSWIEKILSSASGQRREKLKAALNGSLKEAYAAGKSYNLSLRELTKALNDTGDETTKYEAIELCYDLLAAKGSNAADEARIIDLVAKSLELDLSELEKIRDIKIVNLAAGLSQSASVEELLGIDPRWDAGEIKRHLRNEFQKWNNRLTALPEGPDRDSAQKMLDAISDARKRYG